jgi:hypothetical protein
MKFNGPGNTRPFTGMNTNLGGISNGGLNLMGARANSASFALQQPKLRHFENLIVRLKKILE